MLKQKNYLTFEEQYHCDVCSEAVTNPICPICLTMEIEAWLTLYPNLRNELLPRINNYLKRVKEKMVDATQCIKCRDKRASICPYCFTDYVFAELKKLNISNIVFKEFLQFFSYDREFPNPHAEKWARVSRKY